jgi:sugar/nucleoside kinase (ribokinase family)
VARRADNQRMSGTASQALFAGAGEALAAAAGRGLPRAVVGFDGFIDSIIHMVDQRRDMTRGGYSRLATIKAFAERCASAAGKSTNIEQVLLEERFGGNGPLMAGALGSLGFGVTFIGAVGTGESGVVHPVFRPMAARCERVIPLGVPSWTDCLEFEDGKLMFNNTADVQDITWELLVKVVGIEGLREIVGRAALIGIVNWSLLGGVPGIWRGLCREVLPGLAGAVGMSGPRRLFIDISDPAKRTDEDVRECVEDLRRLAAVVPTTLGLNLSEAERVARVLGVGVLKSPAADVAGNVVREAAEALLRAVGVECVVIHPRHGAAAAMRASGGTQSAWVQGPYTESPRLSTGAGDHFNAGFAAAQTLGLGLEQCLAVACSVSGVYVRDAQSPTMGRLCEFMRVGR